MFPSESNVGVKDSKTVRVCIVAAIALALHYEPVVQRPRNVVVGEFEGIADLHTFPCLEYLLVPFPRGEGP